MELNSFPGCCGIGIVYHLDSEYDRMRTFKPETILDKAPKETFDMLKTMIANAIGEFHWGLLIATTNDAQSATDKILEMFGFNLLHSFKNPNHHMNNVKVWGLNIFGLTAEEINTITYPETEVLPTIETMASTEAI